MIKPLAVRIDPSTVYRVERDLPAEGEILVHIGDLVQPGVPIARALIPAPPANVPVAGMLGVRSKDLAAYLVKQVGDQVKAGEVIARKRATLLGGKRECVSPIDGTVDFISYDHGQVTIRRPERPGMIWAEAVGRVTEVVPRRAVVVEAGGAHVAVCEGRA